MSILRRPRRRKGISLADDARMQKRDVEANTFYKLILVPDEEPGFVSDEANLRDITLAPDEEIIQRVQQHYGVILHSNDFQKPFWSLLDFLNGNEIG